MRQRIPPEITRVYGHQEDAFRAIRARRTTLISTGTGSGKTECFLYPIISRCLELRDEGAPAGISAVIVYPMNALAEDQLGRLRGLLAGTGIPFGMYVGKTPDREAEVTGVRLPPGASRADYLAALERQRHGETVHPPEEVCSREVMRTRGRQPRILLTNVKQLELLLTRQQDVELFADARLDFLVFDEAHTFTGALGAETACLIRRLRTFCGRDPRETVCIATSATIVDRENPDAARQFAARFFGVDPLEVATVGEAYEAQTWSETRISPAPPSEDPAALLNDCVAAVDAGDGGRALRQCYRRLSGGELPERPWEAALAEALLQNELVFQTAELLSHPRALDELATALSDKVRRHVSEAEILAWLTLGAAARIDGRPLLRPVVHVFVRGISGAVVTFEDEADTPRLWLAAEDEAASHGGDPPHAHFRVTTCTTCGQHYFVGFLKDFEFTGSRPGGGQSAGDRSYWEPLEEAKGGSRLILIDHIVGGEEDDDLAEHDRLAALWICRRCGAAHPDSGARCLHCGRLGGLVRLYAVRQKAANPGVLSSCLSCGANGRTMFSSVYREPARPVRATNVADVHVLAQDMVHHAERPRLLVFCDNRQDAAFQAGWMKDHARRYRLRALMAQGLKDGPMSVGDLTRYVDDLLERDEALSRALVPEVWLVQRREGGGGRHEKERLKFLRFQVLREVTMSARQPIGLEPWGRLRIEYRGLESSAPWIQREAHRLGMPAEDFRDGVAGLLDYLRRRRVLHDPEHEIFTRYWQDGDLEIQQGYLPQLGAPAGTKLRRDPTEKQELVIQWLSDRGDTTIRQIARKWGVRPADAEAFVEDLFSFLADQGLLVPVRLKGSKGRAIPGVTGVYQVDADRLRLQHNHGVWRCRSCRRRSPRRTPYSKCLAWRCTGELEFVREDPDNYDLQLLDQNYAMLRPEEHTAMVPHDERERLENLFKGSSDAVNAFVCTPTLELGVDIGQLDAILMRNVPPLPANYWQRAGRAGRRHRMAVNVTYCRPVSHDRAYFADPPKLLGGRVDPPAFNLRNDQMVAKHVHAAVITGLHQLARDPSRSADERRRIDDALRTCLPATVTSYLFEAGAIRSSPFDLSALEAVIAAHADELLATMERTFARSWPASDAVVVSPSELGRHVGGFCAALRDVIVRLERRLRWAMSEINRLNRIQATEGALGPEDDSLRRRCESMVRRLKGIERRRRREAEGYDDVSTFGVLAAEGFLPGYGLEVGSVLGTAEVPFWRLGAMEFALPRPPSVALREYVPGNLIYANGNRFVARRFHRDADESRMEMPLFEVSLERQAVKETSATRAPGAAGAAILPAIAVCDVDLFHQSHISDEEELRFQLGVAVYGYERDQHNGGRAFRWGEQTVHLRRGVRLRLVNVGSTAAIQRGQQFGYPVCTVCGHSVSPLSSDRQREHFEQDHLTRCGRKPVPVGFYADVAADTFSLPACADATTAYSVLEALRLAATEVLDMHVEDLQILVIGHVDRDEVDGLLWDPMPGGSGLLDQICERFEEIAEAARRIVESCPSVCATSCIDCLQTFRNAHYHKLLERKTALERMLAWGPRLTFSHDIPAKQPVDTAAPGAQPVNEAERRLRYLLQAAGFAEGIRGEQIRLDVVLGTTTPDVIFRAPHHGPDEGVCIYLDGLSGHLHGHPATADRDRAIRTWLRNNGWDVIEIAASDLYDAGAMQRHFRRLASYLRADDLRARVQSDTSWFARSQAPSPPARFVPRVVRPSPRERYKTCVPLVPLKAAAGWFSDPQNTGESADWDWVAIESPRRLRPGMFVAQVVGRSMEPQIPDGAYCLFSTPVEGSRQGRTVLVRLRDQADPESGERYTVKRYFSEKAVSDEGTWRHVRITLKPNNPEFQPIELATDDEASVSVIAEVVEVLG
jgi:SOS-response transcriptional repressor LexA/ribosomal protein L40E